jgi:hypothetical protein
MGHFVRFEKVIDPDSMMSLMLAALSEIDPNDLAYLFATGKSELEIRNQVALHMHRNLDPDYIVTREWHRHDLAVLEDGKPQVLIEGKSWIHADAVNPGKMYSGKNSIVSGLERDIRKLYSTRETNPAVNIFISTVLFTIDVQRSTNKRLLEAGIPYADTHRRGIKNHENAIELVGRGRRELSELLSRYGIVKRSSLKTGYFHEFRVEADIFLFKPEVIFVSDNS